MPAPSPPADGYYEVVPASRWLMLLLFASAFAAAAGAVAIWLADDPDRWVGVVALGLTAALLLLVARWFSALYVTVNDGGVTARYGPFERRLARDTITAAEVEHYPWLVYAGWGIRYGTRGRRAWSVPFVSAGVAMTTTAGQQYHVSSRDPERLRAAVVDSLAGQGE